MKAFDSADRELAAGLFEQVRKLSAGRVGVTRPSYSEIEGAAIAGFVGVAQQARNRHFAADAPRRAARQGGHHIVAM